VLAGVPTVTREEMVARAEALVPALAGRARHEVWQGSNNAYHNGLALPPSFLQAFPLAPGEEGVEAPIGSVDRLIAWQAASRLP